MRRMMLQGLDCGTGHELKTFISMSYWDCGELGIQVWISPLWLPRCRRATLRAVEHYYLGLCSVTGFAWSPSRENCVAFGHDMLYVSPPLKVILEAHAGPVGCRNTREKNSSKVSISTACIFPLSP